MKRPFLRALAVLGIANSIAILILLRVFFNESTTSEKMMEVIYGGAKNLSILREPDRIEMFQFLGAGIHPNDIPPFLPKRFGFAILRGPVVADAILQRTLAAELTNSRKIRQPGVSLCIFEPDYLFSFQKDDDSVEILLSVVSCPEFQVYRNGERIDSDSVTLDLLFDDEVYPGFGYYKNSSPYLGDLLREAFMPELDTIVRDARFGTHSSTLTNSVP